MNGLASHSSVQSPRGYEKQRYATAMNNGARGVGTSHDDTAALNALFADAASRDRKVAYLEPRDYYVTGEVTDSAGQITAIYGNGARILYVGTGKVFRFANDAPHIFDLRFHRETVGADLWEDLKPGGTYEGTVAIEAPKMRSRYWHNVNAEGFAFGVDQPINQSVNAGYRVSRCGVYNCDFSGCLNGWVAYCANGGFFSNVTFQKFRYSGANVFNGSTVTGISKASPAVVTAANDYVDGDVVYMDSVGGMTEVNGKFYTVKNPTSTNYELYSFDPSGEVAAAAIDSTGYTTYTSGGEGKVYKGTAFRGYNDGTSTSDAFPRAFNFIDPVIERHLYMNRINANGKGNVIVGGFIESGVYNVYFEDKANNPNCQYLVLGDQDESSNILSNPDYDTQKMSQFTGDRDFWIQSLVSLINNEFGIGKTSDSLTTNGTVFQTAGGAEIVAADETLDVGITSAGARHLMRLFRNNTELGSFGVDASDHLDLTSLNKLILRADQVEFDVDGSTVSQFDNASTAGGTRFFLWDVDAGSMKRVFVGAADSGGTGYKALRIAN